MKISDDDLIRKLLDADSKVKVPVYGIDPVNFAGAYRIHVSRDALITFARELIALAQEVEPLKWNGRSAVTSIGEYVVFNFNKQLSPLAPGYYSLYLNQDPLQKCETEEQAIKAAQQDYARRVLSGLKYGGVE